MLSESIEEGESIFVLSCFLSCQLFFQSDLFFLGVILLQSGLNVHSASHNCSNAFSERIDLQIVDCPIQGVEFLGVEFSNKTCKLFANMVLNHITLDFGRLFDVVVKGFEDFQNEFESFLTDVSDCNLSNNISTRCPFSMASASTIYCIALNIFESILYSFLSTMIVSIWTEISLYCINLKNKSQFNLRCL